MCVATRPVVVPRGCAEAMLCEVARRGREDAGAAWCGAAEVRRQDAGRRWWRNGGWTWRLVEVVRWRVGEEARRRGGARWERFPARGSLTILSSLGVSIVSACLINGRDLCRSQEIEGDCGRSYLIVVVWSEV